MARLIVGTCIASIYIQPFAVAQLPTIPDPVQKDAEQSKRPSLEELEKRLRERTERARNQDSKDTEPPSRSRQQSKQTEDDYKEKSDKNQAESDKNAPVREAMPTLELDAQSMGQQLQLSDVIASTYRAFPLLEIARLQAGVAGGQQTSAWGAYDTKLEYFSLNQPVGFYETYRNGIGFARQLWWGGYASAGYRIGRGNYEPWYKERETNDGGEFKVALVQPLLQGRAIDPQRVELFQANLRQQAVGPEIQHQLLMAGQDASRAFWIWVEAGTILKARENLLDIAEKRGVQLEKSFQADKAARLDVDLNAAQIYERLLKVNEAKQKFRDAAFKLSLFLRDEGGAPMLVPPEWLPNDFPEIVDLPPGVFEDDYRNALARRPELVLIKLEMQSQRWDLSLAQNQMLPNLDFTVQSVQNMGQGTSSLNDKGEFQLEAGVVGGVPIQRRKPIGKIQSTQSKLAQFAQKYELQRNKIGIDLQVARNALDTAQRNVAVARDLVKRSRAALEGFRKGTDAGLFDFAWVLNQELKVNESEVKLLEAEREFYVALAELQAALGLDPLEQAANLGMSLR
ncbi:MAG: TolC family protein [Pirellula sp.]